VDQPLADLAVRVELENGLTAAKGRQEDHHVKQQVPAPRISSRRIENGGDLLGRIFEFARLGLALHVRDPRRPCNDVLGHRPIERAAKSLEVAADSRRRDSLSGPELDELPDEGRRDRCRRKWIGHPADCPLMRVKAFENERGVRISLWRREAHDVLGKPTPRDVFHQHLGSRNRLRPWLAMLEVILS